MKASDLKKLSIEDLITLSSKDLVIFQMTLNDAIERRKDQDKSDFMDKVATLATESGFALEEVLLTPPRKTPSIKYRNPEEPTQGWSGRGRKPNWLLALIESGRSIEEFEV
ncbi:MAG: H-NS histone family protein [Methylococcaceae bacterium]|nr:H-NS histone family protein [Methylococcaceae bacterium]